MKRLKTWFLYPAVCGIIAVMVGLYELSFAIFPLLGAAGCLTVKKMRKQMRLEQEYEDEYQQVTIYLEQLLCSYRRMGHAGKALGDCVTIFSEKSRMGKAVREARHILLTGEGVEDGYILEAAFFVIERVFDSRRMRIVHQFICNGERTGGDCGASIDILLEDLQLWKNRTQLYQNRKRFIKVECGIATILSVVLCYVSRLLTPSEMGFRISDSGLYQISTTFSFLTFFFVLSNIYKKLSGSWLDERGQTGEKQEKKMEKMYRIVQGETGKCSALSRHMARKLLDRYVKKEFPYWLLLVTLYLQTESSYQAICHSIKETTGVFRKELETLTEGIYDAPRSLEPYLGFFSGVRIPELQTGMKILYSVNANGYEESKKQMDFLVSQNNRLMNQYEGYRQMTKMAGMSLLKQLPMVISCGKLLLDLINLLTMTMANFQNLTV